jgi:hypothetical protein
MRYLVLGDAELEASDTLRAIVLGECAHTQAHYELCSYAIPLDHPELATILLCVTDPDWVDYVQEFEPGRITVLA